jgi:hypothetical protein
LALIPFFLLHFILYTPLLLPTPLSCINSSSPPLHLTSHTHSPHPAYIQTAQDTFDGHFDHLSCKSTTTTATLHHGSRQAACCLSMPQHQATSRHCPRGKLVPRREGAQARACWSGGGKTHLFRPAGVLPSPSPFSHFVSACGYVQLSLIRERGRVLHHRYGQMPDLTIPLSISSGLRSKKSSAVSRYPMIRPLFAALIATMMSILSSLISILSTSSQHPSFLWPVLYPSRPPMAS